jgi:protein-tyrosine phosphatase
MGFDIDYRGIIAVDVPTFPIHEFFDETFDYIDKAITNGKVLLVHCQGGVSRSATVVTAYLMRKYKWEVEKTLLFLQEKRPIVYPNYGFVCQLLDYQHKLFS